jgi:hypothetical protein
MLGNGREEFRFVVKNGEAQRFKNPLGSKRWITAAAKFNAYFFFIIKN